MLSMKAGKNMSWEPFSKGMTHGFVLEFRNQEELDYYLTEDPVHAAFSKAAKPYIEDSVVIGTFFFSEAGLIFFSEQREIFLFGP
jgi:hypothetical protein